ncbi:MAG: Pectinacetylesterase [Firmicutes bacterium ADurb.Bin248]|nr:MAG: Pectinacetylesterase [Firmicutes bacterium ADurb.Bin248]
MIFLARLLAFVAAPFLMFYTLLRRARFYKGAFPKTRRWYRVKLPGCVCSDGSNYCAYYKKGTTNKTAVYFSGGGASWNEHTAARPTTVFRLFAGRECYYFPFARFYMEIGMTGLAAADDERNPLDEYNAIYLPYATADFFLGRSEFPYREGRREKTLYHRGLANVRAALAAAPREFFEAETVFIGGESAGAFAAAAWTAELAPLFPKCGRFVLYVDGGQMCYPGWKEILRDTWKTEARHRDCLADDGQLMRDWLIDLNRRLGGGVTCLFSVSPYDETLSQYESKLAGGPFKPSREATERFHVHLREALRALLQEIPAFRAYIYNYGLIEKTGGTAHTIARVTPALYGHRADGISVAEWIARALAGEDAPNVGLGCMEL